MIFKLGLSAHLIAKAANLSEAEIYRYLNGEKTPPDAEAKLERLWLDLVEIDLASKHPK